MAFFNRVFMNGATLLGVALTLFAITFALENRLNLYVQILFFFIAYLYLSASILAFLFPSLS